jgi:hypothetical protein
MRLVEIEGKRIQADRAVVERQVPPKPILPSALGSVVFGASMPTDASNARRSK